MPFLYSEGFKNFLFEEYSDPKNGYEVLFSVKYNGSYNCAELYARAVIIERKADQIFMKKVHEESELIREWSTEASTLFWAGVNAAEKIIGRIKTAFETGKLDPLNTIKDQRFKTALQKLEEIYD
jgi:hypothetical protein